MKTPLVELSQVIRVHYGAALKEVERVQTGPHEVFGSSGVVGHHSKSLFDHPSIVIGRKGSVGSVTYAPRGGWAIDTTFFIERLVPQKCELRYLYYALAQANLARHTITTSIPGLSRGDIYRTRIPLPAPAEQRRIADILDKADAIRRKRKEAVALTEDLLRSAFLKMFGNPVTNLKRWPVRLLGRLGELDRGRSRHRPRNDPALLGGRHPLIQTGEVANCDGVIRSYEQTYSEFGLAQSRMWPAGTLCITIAANIAKTGILAFDACFPDSVVGFTPGPNVTTEYIQYWMSFLQPILERQAPQVAQKNINLEILRALGAPTPPLDLQRTFSRFVTQIRRTRARMHLSFESADALFCSLTARAFRGKLVG